MDNSDKLVEYLKNMHSSKYVTAKELSNIFEVTDRTIRNYVKTANERYDNIILTSKYGYRYKQSDIQLSYIEKNDFSKSIDSRRFFIIREMFKNNLHGVNIFDIAERLCVSESTVKSDISMLNKATFKYDLSIKQKHFNYFLVGTDRDKRKFMIDMMNSSYQSFNINLYIENFLEKISLKGLKKIVEESFYKFELEMNTYFLENFLLHLAIAIDRSSNTINYDENINYEKVNGIISHLSNNLLKRHGIKLLQTDMLELSMLLETEGDGAVLDNYIDNEIRQVVKDTLNEISYIYLLEFNDEKFINRLLIHIQNLYRRSINNVSARNFNLPEIKTKYPVLFDIAIFLSVSLSERLGIGISDEEMAFLSLHIGTFVQNTKNNNDKIATILITQFYNSNEKILKKKIEEFFGTDIIITEVVDSISRIDKNKLDNSELIISTISGINIANTTSELVYIKELMFDDDKDNINNKIREMKHTKFRKYLETFLPKLFPKELYFKVAPLTSKNEIFRDIEKKFLAYDFVYLGYYKLLEQRERLSSTAFPSGIAIPHTVKYESKKTGIMVMNFNHEIYWGHNDISLMMCLSINKEDSGEFNKLFPRIVEIVSEELNVRILNNSLNSEDFIKRLTQLILSDGYYL